MDAEARALLFRLIQKRKISEDGQLSDVAEGRSEVAAYIKLDRLEFNRLTGQALEDLLNSASQRKLHALKPLIARFLPFFGSSFGRLQIPLDRTIFQDKLMLDGITMDVTILRNSTSTGIRIHCLPSLRSAVVHGMITIDLNDNELQVLLVNQKSLLNIAYSKWSCMELVGSWLASRLRVHTTPLLPSTPLTKTTFGKEAKENVNEEEAEGVIDQALEITVDRTIELGDIVIIEWRQRNAPHLSGAVFHLSAVQDLELLRIRVEVLFTGNSASESSLGVPPMAFSLSSCVSWSELLVFGTCDRVETSKVALGAHIDVMHPSAFMWNIIGRLTLSFQVTQEVNDFLLHALVFLHCRTLMQMDGSARHLILITGVWTMTDVSFESYAR